MESPNTLYEFFQLGGTLAMGTFVVFMLSTERWVPKRRMEDWKELAIGSTKLAESATQTAAQSTNVDSVLTAQIRALQAELALLQRQQGGK